MEISVISFNIRNSDDPNGNSVKERAPRLSTVTSKYDADVIGFQEYKPIWQPYIEKYYLDKYDMFNQWRSSSDSESSPILWKKDKFECVKTGYFWLSDTPETESRGWDEVYNCFRMCVYVILKDKESGKKFTFMNTHFGFGDNGQVKSVKLIDEYSKKISSYPTFVVGDFNMRPDTPAYALMSELFTDVNKATVNDLRTTFHAYDPENVKLTHIDYCFADKNVKPISQKIMDDLVDGMFPSDHYGIHMKLDL